MLRPALMARHSLVYSSITVNCRTAFPPRLLIWTKSKVHTWFFLPCRSRTQGPSFSQGPPLLGCLAGTFSPSRRQIRSTRWRLTFQPARPSRAVAS